MASPVIDVHCDAPDPADQPATFTEACAKIDQLLRAEMQGADAYLPYVVSNSAPGVSDQDKVWIQTDSAGRPIAIKTFFGGNWRSVYTGAAGEVKMFTGDPSQYFDATGRGIVGQSWDGWALMNGRNGTPNWTDQFVVGAHMDGSSGIAQFQAGWQTAVAAPGGFGPLKQGGRVDYVLPQGAIPTPAQDAVIVDLFSATGDARADTGAMFGKHSAATGANGQVQLQPAVEANIPPDPVIIVPPFRVCAWVLFIGYP